MAQAKTAATPERDIEQLSEQIAALKQDMAEISHTLGELGRSSRDAAAGQARRKASELRAAGERQIDAAQHRAEELGHQAADAVRQQPAAAVGLAVGVGFLLGFMTGRK